MPTTFKSTLFQDTELINASQYSSLVDYNLSEDDQKFDFWTASITTSIYIS
jgi:hypothetical protein